MNLNVDHLKSYYTYLLFFSTETMFNLMSSRRFGATVVLPFEDQKPLNGYLTNSENSDEMQLNASLDQDLHSLSTQNRYSENEM